MRNIFFEKSYTKCGGETIPRPFLRKLKLGISLYLELKVLCSLFPLNVILRAIDIYGNYAADYLLLPHLKLFLKNKKRPTTSRKHEF